MISVGCCYNLLSEDDTVDGDNQCGFPVSKGAKSSSFKLGKNARDLACQVAFFLTCQIDARLNFGSVLYFSVSRYQSEKSSFGLADQS